MEPRSANNPSKITLNNPFRKLPGYNCFGCSPGNPVGLRMSFRESGDEIISEWEPEDHFQGFFRMLHGGIQATLMDEIASWVVYVKLKTAGFTSRADIRYRKAVHLTDGPLTIRAVATGLRRNLADINVKLFNNKGELCSEGDFVYFTFPPEKAKSTMYYPEHREFYSPPESEGNI